MTINGKQDSPKVDNDSSSCGIVHTVETPSHKDNQQNNSIQPQLKQQGKRRRDDQNNMNKNNNKKRNRKRFQNKKRQFWVDNIKDINPPKDRDPESIIRLRLTSVELSDDHMRGDKTDNSSVQGSKQEGDGSIELKEPKHNDKKKVNDNIQNDNNTPDKDKSTLGDNSPKSSVLKPFVQVIVTESGKRRITQTNDPYLKLPNGDCGDGVVNPFSNDEVDNKYWAQRKRLFSKFDEGIQLDKESWYSVTPEAIANHIARRMSKELEKMTEHGIKQCDGVILDSFCGCGGNAIGFANLKSSLISLVVCVDIDRSKLKMAANNASIYGVSTDRIVFIEGDVTFILQQCYKDGILVDFSQLTNVKKVETENHKGYNIGGYNLLPQNIDAIFLSPPWGGPSYMNDNKKGYSLRSISLQTWDKENIDGQDLLILAKNACKTKLVVYFLPRNVNGHDIGKSVWRVGYKDMEIEKNMLNGKLKTVTMYLTQS